VWFSRGKDLRSYGWQKILREYFTKTSHGLDFFDFRAIAYFILDCQTSRK
jgi:hypothetical protein